MRIRKRLALCSSPTPPPLLSDLQLRRAEAAKPSSQRYDPPKQPSDQTNGWVFPKYEEKMKQKVESLQKSSFMEFGDDVNTNNDIRKIVSICRGEDGLNTNMQPSSSSLEEEEDYKLVPLKKRKGTFERNPNEETASAKMKSKTNKKYGDDAVALFNRKSVIEEDGMYSSCSSGAKKSKRRGNVIMEGSRCSRVNGRGWRCCQPTLVGYSLCEHHLGKGRLRSMADARRHHPNEGNLQPLFTKKRSKVGVVKARSMTSLLSQI